MASTYTEELLLVIMADAEEADATIASTAKGLQDLARRGGASIDSLTEAWKRMATPDEGSLDPTLNKWITRAGSLAKSWDNVAAAKDKALAGQEVKGQGIVDAGIANKNAQRSAEEMQAQSIVDAGIAKRNASRTKEELQAQAIIDAGIAKRNSQRSAEELLAQEIVDAGIAQRNATRNKEVVKGQAVVDAGIAQKNADALRAEQKAQDDLAASKVKAQGIDDARIAKLNAEKAAQDALNASLANGTATTKQYAEALKTTMAASTPQTQALGGIGAGSPVNPAMVAQVKASMMELVNVTSLNVDKIKAILGTAFTNVPTGALTQAVVQVKTELVQVPTKATQAGNSMKTMWAKFSNTTLGILTAQLIHAVIQGLKQLFKTAVEYATKARAQMAQLNFAEAVLSKRGMDITREELDGFISDIEKKFKYLSKLDITGIVSTVAQMGIEFGITKEKILGLSDAIAFIQLTERAYGQTISDTGSIVNAALDGRSNYFNKLGINITKTAIKEKAYAMGIAENGAAITKEQSNQAAIALLIEQTTGKYEELIASIEKTNPALAKQLQTELLTNNATKELADEVIVLKDSWNAFLLSITDGGTKVEALGAAAAGVLGVLKLLATALAIVWKVLMGISGILAAVFIPGITGVVGFIKILQQLFALDFKGAIETWKQMFYGIGKGMWEAVKAGWEAGGDPFVFLDFGKSEDVKTNTATGEAPPPIAPEIDISLRDKQFDELTKLNDDILAAELGFKHDMEDIQIDLGRKLVDISSEYGRKREDAARTYGEKIADIERSYADKIADINRSEQEAVAKDNEDKIKREEDFQRKLQELKENYMENLAEATTARDAKKIVDLTNTYKKEVAQATRAHNDEEADAKRAAEARRKDYEQQRKDAAIERDRKLAEAALDYKNKLEELDRQENDERARAQEEARRKQEDLEKALKEKYEAMFENLKNEYNLTDQSLMELVALYQQKYGEILGISQEMLDAMKQSIQDAPVPTPNPPLSGTSPTGGSRFSSSGANTLPSRNRSGLGTRNTGENFVRNSSSPTRSLDSSPIASQQNIIQLSSGVTIEQVRGIISKNNAEIMNALLETLR